VTQSLFPLILLVALLLPARGHAAGGNPNPGILPLQSKPFGLSYEDWFERWWNWIFSLPAEESPPNFNANQGGKVFFLPHTFFGNTLETSCTVPAGRAIFASAGGTIWVAPFDGQTEAELRQGVLDSLPVFTNLRIIVDGREVQNIDQYVIVTDGFDFFLPEGFGVPAGTYRAVAGGWNAILAPLPPGAHTIVVHDETIFGDVAEAIIHLTVVTPAKSAAEIAKMKEEAR
jgi:hypothetical protein